MWRLTRDDENWALSGFEIIFPMLLEKAKHLGIDIPLDDPMLEAIRAKRELKLNKYVYIYLLLHSIFFFSDIITLKLEHMYYILQLFMCVGSQEKHFMLNQQLSF